MDSGGLRGIRRGQESVQSAEGRLPDGDRDAQHLRSIFHPKGFDDKEGLEVKRGEDSPKGPKCLKHLPSEGVLGWF